MLGQDRGAKGGIASVIDNYFSSDLIKEHHVVHIPTSTGKNVLFRFIKALWTFIFFLIFRKVDIVHLHSASRRSFYRKSVFVLLSKLFRKKVIFHLHGSEFNIFFHQESGRFKKYYIKKMLGLSDVLITLSSQWKSDLEKIVGIEKDIRVLYNGIPFPEKEFKPDDNEVFTVLFMGRITERKGVYDLIRLAEKLIPHFSYLRFVLAGDGEIDKLSSMVAERGWEHYFAMPGWVTDKAFYYSKADVFILPSYSETLPVSLLEAASFSLPIIATSVGGISEVIEDGLSGYLVKPGDVEAMSKRMTELMNHPELRKKMGQKAYEKVRSLFEVNVIVEQLGAIYQELAGR